MVTFPNPCLRQVTITSRDAQNQDCSSGIDPIKMRTEDYYIMFWEEISNTVELSNDKRYLKSVWDADYTFRWTFREGTRSTDHGARSRHTSSVAAGHF